MQTRVKFAALGREWTLSRAIRLFGLRLRVLTPALNSSRSPSTSCGEIVARLHSLTFASLRVMYYYVYEQQVKKTFILLVFAMIVESCRAQAAARGTTRSSSDSCFQHVNSVWLLRLRLFLSLFGDIVNENIVKSAFKYNIVYVFKYKALKLIVKSRKLKLISSANSLQKRYWIL